MKPAVFFAVIALVFTIAASWQTESPIELTQALKLVGSSQARDRVSGFEQLGKLWDTRPQTPYFGFSDTPVEKEAISWNRENLSGDDIDRIATAIQRGIVDEDPKVREAAASAICSAPRPQPEVISTLTAGLNSDDPTVVWYVSQQAVKTPPPISSVIHSLIAKLGSDEFNSYHAASDVLEAYGSKASPYAIQIVDAVLQSKTRRALKMYLLYEIPLDAVAAEKLASAATDFTPHELGIAAVSLLDHPHLLMQINSRRPDTISALQEQSLRLYWFLCKIQSVANETRTWLAASNELLPTTMGLLRERRFIPRIDSAEASATDYEKTLLAACKRACGADPGEQIKVDADHPVEFRPRSAWPEVDKRRMSKKSFGHGDGATFVMLTGEVRDTNGTHPASIEFFRVNDGMLLGTKLNIPEEVLYDPTTGRFVFYTTVFAAYSTGDDEPEPGPYQTGSAQIRVESKGYKPLTLQFFDEMPDVVITLSRRT